MMLMIKKLYLAGGIAGLTYKQATELRDKAKDLLSDAGIEVLDPMRNEGDLKESKAIGIDMQACEMQEIVARDLKDIKESDGIVILTGDTPSWGTGIEFGYTYFVEQKPVFMISKNAGRYGWAHFLATKVCPTIEDLVKYLKTKWRE